MFNGFILGAHQQQHSFAPLEFTLAASPEVHPDLLTLEEPACLDALLAAGEGCLLAPSLETPQCELYLGPPDHEEAQSSHASRNLFEEIGELEVTGMEVPMDGLDVGLPPAPMAPAGHRQAHSDTDLLNWGRMQQEGCGSSATNHHVNIADFEESSSWQDHQMDTPAGHGIQQAPGRPITGLPMPPCTQASVQDVYLGLSDVLMGEGDGLLLAQGLDGLPGIVLPSLDELESDSERQAIQLGATLDRHMEEFLQVMGVDNCQEVVQLAKDPAPTPETEKRIDVKVTKALLELRVYALGIYARRYLQPGGEGLQGGEQALARSMLCEGLEAFFLEKLKALACKCWGLLHFKYPFPDANIKKKLSQYSDRTSRQVNDWFTNWRARSWKPIFLRARRRLMKVSYAVFASVVLRKHFQEKRAMALPRAALHNGQQPFVTSAMDLDCFAAGCRAPGDYLHGPTYS